MDTETAMRLSMLALALAYLALTGCAKNGAPVIVSPAPPPVVSNQGSEVALNRTLATQSGAKLKVQFVTAINPDCTTIVSGNVRPVKQPARGALTIKPADDFVYFPPANPRSACNAKRVKGTLVEYQSPADFKGTDSLAYDVFLDSGGVAHHTITINVL